jgi:hypothetical protein
MSTNSPLMNNHELYGQNNGSLRVRRGNDGSAHSVWFDFGMKQEWNSLSELELSTIQMIETNRLIMAGLWKDDPNKSLGLTFWDRATRTSRRSHGWSLRVLSLPMIVTIRMLSNITHEIERVDSTELRNLSDSAENYPSTMIWLYLSDRGRSDHQYPASIIAYIRTF